MIVGGDFKNFLGNFYGSSKLKILRFLRKIFEKISTIFLKKNVPKFFHVCQFFVVFCGGVFEC